MTNVIISPTLHEEKRLEAISYFSRCSKENVIAVAIIEAKKRYFNDCSFIKIILQC